MTARRVFQALVLLIKLRSNPTLRRTFGRQRRRRSRYAGAPPCCARRIAGSSTSRGVPAFLVLPRLTIIRGQLSGELHLLMTMPALPTRLGAVRINGRVLLLGASLIALAAIANASWFRVRQNEVAYVTRFGQVVNPQAGPLQPGLHFKLPLADEAIPSRSRPIP